MSGKEREVSLWSGVLATPDGMLILSSEFNAIFLKYLEGIQSSTDLIEQKLIV